MSLAYEAFNLYVRDQRKAWHIPFGEPNPPSLTFNNWMKTSGVVEKYIDLAFEERKNRPKTTKQLNDEYAIALRATAVEKGAKKAK